VLLEHLGQAAIKSWIDANWIVDMDNEVLVQVSSGLFFKSMILKVHEIRASNQNSLSLPDLTSSNDQDQKFASTPTLQYALHESEVYQVKQTCLEYINAVSNCPLDPETIIEDTPKIIWKSLQYIRRYLRKNSAAREASILAVSLDISRADR
jgi:hypothetical protein